MVTDADDEIDGRFIEVVNEYASSCDWCGELTSHVLMSMDAESQLGYCDECKPVAIERGLLFDEATEGRR